MPSIITEKFHNDIDQYQVIFTQLIISEFFPWTCLVLLLTYKNWKRFIIILMVVHYLLRCFGDMHERSLYVRDQDHPQWPFGNSQWMKTYGIASVLWHSSEIIGDWYLLIRTKAIVKNNKKIIWIFVSCVIYNLVKLTQIYSFISYVPFRKGFDEVDEEMQNAYYTLDMADFKTHKWTNVALQQICSLIYDISVFIVLRKYVFNDKEGMKLIDKNGNSFLRKFKQISEYRIILSIIVTLCGIPLIFTYASYVYYCSRNTSALDGKEKIDSVNAMVNDSVIDPIRTLILNFSYIFMYIDQIMLRFYAEEKQTPKITSSGNSAYGYGSNLNISNINNSQTHSITQNTAPIISYNNNNNNNYNNYNNYNNFNNDSYEINKNSYHSISMPSNDTTILNPKYNVNYIGYYNYDKFN